MTKQEELQKWKERLAELSSKVIEQIDRKQEGFVYASKRPNCPDELNSVANELVAIQNNFGEYQRSQISQQAIQRLKYYSKKKRCSFEEAISAAVDNSRYLSKDTIEARAIADFVLDINRVYEEIYKKYNVFPINAMDAETKRGCRNFKTDVTVTEKVQAIIEVYLPELKGINIVERDYSIVPQSLRELTDKDIQGILEYISVFAEDGKIDAIFADKNKDDVISLCRLLAKSNMTLDKFLKTYTDLTYSKCYSVDVVPAVKQMINSYSDNYKTTRKITTLDPYLRHKIEVAQKATDNYSMRELVDYLDVKGDNDSHLKPALSRTELKLRCDYLLKRLDEIYPEHCIDKDFITTYPDLYELLKLLTSRYEFNDINEFLNHYGFSRESSHEMKVKNVVYLSENDLIHYNFNELSDEELKQCCIKELDPVDYFGTYNKLIYKKLDCTSNSQKVPKPREVLDD